LKGIQIWANYEQGETGQLSVISVTMQFGGCLARVFTSIQETNWDWLIIAPFVVASILNGIILAQILYYGSNNATSAKRTSKKRN